MELVTEPVVHSSKQAGDFCRELQTLMRTIGASEANMEKGEMRVEANISVSRDATKLGVKCEVKNLNSFKSMERAIDYEVSRQIDILESGGEVVQETRGWDEVKQVTFSQRKKEGSADYRYFPDPDLSKLKLSEHPELSGEGLLANMPLLPDQVRSEYGDFGISSKDIDVYLLDPALHAYFKEVINGLESSVFKLASNYTLSDVATYRSGDSFPVTPNDLRKILVLLNSGDLSSRAAKDIIKIIATEGGDPDLIAKERGLLQVSDDSAVRAAIIEVMNENQKSVDEYISGKTNAAQFLVGQSMKKMKGAGNPVMIQKILTEELQKLSTA